MKKHLLTMMILLTVTNLYSQPERLDELLKNKIKDPLFQNEEGFNKSVFENHSNQILKTAIFDSTSVVDSVIFTRENGDNLFYWR